MLDKTMQRVVILLSGGLDSATTLAIAKSEGMQCYALTVDYGQRHQAELDAAVRVAHALKVAEHKIIRVNLNSIGGSALTDLAIAVPEQPTLGIPITYVPARNTVLLALALGWAEVLRAEAIYIGVNALDYSGYPDCRPEFILAFQQLATLATKSGVEGKALRILAPLLYHSKADIIRCGQALGLDYSLTVSCYQADPQGRACGHCDSCRIRAQGFAAVGVTDPAT